MISKYKLIFHFYREIKLSFKLIVNLNLNILVPRSYLVFGGGHAAFPHISYPAICSL